MAAVREHPAPALSERPPHGSEVASAAATASDVVTSVLAGEERIDVHPGRATDVHLLACRDPRFLQVEPSTALEAQLQLLIGLAPVTHASAWLADEGDVRCVARAGAARPRRIVKQVARRTLGGPGNRDTARALRGLQIERWGAAYGALVFEPHRRHVRAGLAAAGEVAAALSPILERKLMLDESEHTGGQLLEAAERRIARLRFDIHDGPLQDAALLSGELAGLERQLTALVPEDRERAVVERRVADLRAIVVDFEQELRELVLSAGADRAILSLHDVLAREVSHFSRRTGVDAQLDIDEDLGSTTPSQRIAIARLVEEALANVREHARATRARVAVSRQGGSLSVVVADDGRGFDVGRALRRARRDRRLGLIAMTERIRLLGGQLEIESRPGGPTVLAAVLPAWAPPEVRGHVNGHGTGAK